MPPRNSQNMAIEAITVKTPKSGSSSKGASGDPPQWAGIKPFAHALCIHWPAHGVFGGIHHHRQLHQFGCKSHHQIDPATEPFTNCRCGHQRRIPTGTKGANKQIRCFSPARPGSGHPPTISGCRHGGSVKGDLCVSAASAYGLAKPIDSNKATARTSSWSVSSTLPPQSPNGKFPRHLPSPARATR